jgi:CII-binding regulator of phage lambda lysogenization HflD
MDILKSHMQGTQALVQQIERQTQQQQEAFQRLMLALGQDPGPEIEQQLQKQQETFRRLMRELEQQTHQQQEAFQKLVQASMEVSKNLLYTPLSYYKQSLDASDTIGSV